jgi:hypothetical protein
MSYIYNLTDTWNSAGTTFTALKMNVTDIASAVGSRLVDFQIGGVSKLYLDKSGNMISTGIQATSLSLTQALTISSGGTGSSTAQGARVSLFPSLTGNATKVLAVNAGTTDVEWISLPGGGSVTSVNASGGSTGLTFGGGPITSSGTLTLGGVLSLASGGTGSTTAAGARTNLLPSYTGNVGKTLVVNALGTDVEWSVGGVTSVSGTGTVNGLTLTGTVTGSGSLTLGGTLALTSGQVTTALGFTPYNATNPSGYTSNLGTVTSVAGTGTVNGLTLTGSVTGAGSLTLGGTLSLTSGNVTTALGYTPYNITNPAGYITSAALSSYALLSGAAFTGNISTNGNLVISSGLVRIGSSTNYFYDLKSTGDDFQILEAGTTPIITIKNGNVGIGTTSIPAGRRLVVAGGSVRIDDDNQIEWGGSAVGLYGNGISNSLTFFTNTTARLTINSTGHVTPGAANAQDLGSASLPWRNGFIQNAWTVTSDVDMKQRGAPLSDNEILAGKRIANELCWWKWLKSIEDKGIAARNHFGPMAQDIARIFVECGVELDWNDGNPSFRSDMLCWDEWDAVTKPVMATRTVPNTVLAQTESSEELAVDETEQYETEQYDTGEVEIVVPAGSGWRIDPCQVAFFLIAAINADTERRLALLENSVR